MELDQVLKILHDKHALLAKSEKEMWANINYIIGAREFTEELIKELESMGEDNTSPDVEPEGDLLDTVSPQIILTNPDK